jgi:hypothetical protein
MPKQLGEPQQPVVGGPLPGPAVWHTKALDALGKVTAAYDADKRIVEWSIEAKDALPSGRLDTLDVRFFDADNVRIAGYRFSQQSGIQPAHGVKKGETVRLTLHMPQPETFGRATKVIVDSGSAWASWPERTATPLVKDGVGTPPPSPPEWDLSGLGPFAKVLRTDYDAEARRVVWLLEATKDIDSKILDLFDARFLGADGKPVYSYRFSQHGGVEPYPSVGQGQRLRLTLQLPDAKVMGTAKKVIVTK